MAWAALIPAATSLLSMATKGGDGGANTNPMQAQQGKEGWSLVQPPTGGTLSQDGNKPMGIFDVLNPSGSNNSMLNPDPLQRGMNSLFNPNDLLKNLFGMK